MTEEIKKYLQSVDMEQLKVDYATVQVEKNAKFTMNSWIDFLEKTKSEDEWAYEFWSLSLRALWGQYETDRPKTLEDLQNECIEEIDYLAKHRDMEAKEFTKTMNLDEYGILPEVKEKWYKKWKRN